MPVEALPLSPAVKKEVFKAVIAIAAFITIYLFLILLALVTLSIYGGILLMINMPRIHRLIVGGGLIGLGIMVLLFLVKFLFSSSKAEDSDSILITPETQPELFQFIYANAEEAKTPKPKKVFLSGDVNDSVFYNSGFRSVFLPVKKT